MEDSVIELTDLITLAKRPDSKIQEFLNLCPLILKSQQPSEVLEILKIHPNWKVDFLKHLVNYIKTHSTFKDKGLYQCFSFEFLQDIDFGKISISKRIYLQYEIWKFQFETDFEDLKKISELFLKFNIKVQIYPFIHSSLALEAAKTISIERFKVLAINGNFQIYDDGYNGLIHIIEQFPNDCLEIIQSLIEGAYPKLYNEKMQNILTSVFMQEKFDTNEKLKYLSYLSDRLSINDFSELISAVDDQGNHFMSAVISSKNFSLVKSTLSLIKQKTKLTINQIINKSFDDYSNMRLNLIPEYQKYLKRFPSRRMKNWKIYERFIPINLIETSLNVKFPIMIKYLMSKEYFYRSPTRSGLTYVELIVNPQKGIQSSFENQEEYNQVFEMLSLGDFLVTEGSFELRYEYFDEHFFGKLKKERNSIKKYKHSSSYLPQDKICLIEKVVKQDNYQLLSLILPIKHLRVENKSFCFLYLVVICRCFLQKSTKVLKNASTYFPVQYLVQNLSSVFPDSPNLQSSKIYEAFCRLSKGDFELKEIVQNLFGLYETVRITSIKPFNYSMSNSASVLASKKEVSPEDVSKAMLELIDWTFKKRFDFDSMFSCFKQFCLFKGLKIRDVSEVKICFFENFSISEVLSIGNCEVLKEGLEQLFLLDQKRFVKILLKNKNLLKILKEKLNDYMIRFLQKRLSVICFGPVRKFKDCHKSIENSVISQFAKVNPDISCLQLDLLSNVNFKSFKLIWRENVVEVSMIKSLLKLLARTPDINVFLYLVQNFFENLKKNLKIKQKNDFFQSKSKFIDYVCQIFNLFRLKQGDSEGIAKIEEFIENIPEIPSNIFKSAAILTLINPSLIFTSIRTFQSLISHIQANISKYESQKELLKVSLSHVIPDLFKTEEMLKDMRIESVFLKAIVEINRKNKMIESISKCQAEDMIFLVQTVKSPELAKNILLYFARNCMKEELETFSLNFQPFDRDFLEKINFNAAIGRNLIKFHLILNSDDYARSNFRMPLKNDFICIENCHSLEFLKTLGLLGDSFLVSLLDDKVENWKYLEICLEVVRGFSKLFPFSRQLRENISKDYQLLIDFFTNHFNNLKIAIPEHKLETTEFLSLCFKNKHFDLLAPLIRLLDPDNQHYSKDLFENACSISLDFESKIKKIEKLKENGLSPSSFLLHSIKFNVKITRDLELLQYFFDNFPELEELKSEVVRRVGNYSFVRKNSLYSPEGIASYGTENDLSQLLTEFPVYADHLPKICYLAVKARNKGLCKILLENLSPVQCFELITQDNCDILLHLAFYCMDDELCSLYKILGAEYLVKFKGLTWYDTTVFNIRILNGSYSHIWEPFNTIFDDLIKYKKVFFVYMKKILNEKFGVVLNYDFDLKDLQVKRKTNKQNPYYNTLNMKSNNNKTKTIKKDKNYQSSQNLTKHDDGSNFKHSKNFIKENKKFKKLFENRKKFKIYSDERKKFSKIYIKQKVKSTNFDDYKIIMDYFQSNSLIDENKKSISSCKINKSMRSLETTTSKINTSGECINKKITSTNISKLRKSIKTNDISSNVETLRYSSILLEDMNEIDMIDHLHQILIQNCPIENIEKPLSYLFAMKMIPSAQFFFNLIRKKLKIFKVYLNLVGKDFSHLNPPHICNVQSDFIEQYEAILEYFIATLSSLGDISLAFENCSESLNILIIRNLLIHGKFDLYLLRKSQFFKKNLDLNDIFEFMHENVKKPLELANCFISGGNTQFIFNDVMMNLEQLRALTDPIGTDEPQIFKLIYDMHWYIIKSLKIIKDYSLIQRQDFKFHSETLKEFTNFMNHILINLKSLSTEIGFKVKTSKDLNIMSSSLDKFNYLTYFSIQTVIFTICFKYFSNHRIVQFTIFKNKAIPSQLHNIPKVLQISLNVFEDNNEVIFSNISYPEIIIIEQKDLLSNIKSIREDIKIVFEEFPENYEDLKVVSEYFKDVNNTLFYLIDVKCKDFYDESLDLSYNDYSPAIVDSYKKLFFPSEIKLKLAEVAPITCTESYTIYYNLSNCESELKTIKKKPEKYIINRFQIFDHTFYPYLLIRCRNLFKSMTKMYTSLSDLKCEMNYDTFLNFIIFPSLTFHGLDIMALIEHYFKELEPYLKYIHLGIEYWRKNTDSKRCEDYIGIFLDFQQNVPYPMISSINNIIQYSIPAQISYNAWAFILPDFEHFKEDLLVNLNNFDDLTFYLIDQETIKDHLENLSKTYKISIDIDWESIFNYYKNNAFSLNSRDIVKSLKKLNQDLYTKIIREEYFETILLNDFWEEAVIINSFENFPDTFTIQKIKCEHQFWVKGDKKLKKKGKIFFVYNTSKGISRTTRSLDNKKLSKITKLYIGFQNGTFNCHPTALPYLDSNLIIRWPSSGSIINPFPSPVTVSAEASSNPDILINLKFFTESDSSKSLLSFTNNLEPYTSYLKNYFWYYYTTYKSSISEYFFKKVNFKAKHKVRCFDRKKLNQSKVKKNMEKYSNWVPTFKVSWNEYEKVPLALGEGMKLAKNIADKLRFFLECIELIYNSISNIQKFKNFEGNLFVRPKASLVRKVVSRNLTEFLIKVVSYDHLQINENGIPELYVNPETVCDMTMRMIMVPLTTHILDQDLSKKLYPDVKIVYKKFSGLDYLKIVEKLELYSQIPVMKSFTSLVSKLYFPSLSYKIVVNLDKTKENYSIKWSESENSFIFTFGRLFYNKLNIIEFGEECLRQVSVLRPNKLVIRRFMKTKYKFLNDSQKFLVPRKEIKGYSSRRLESALLTTKENQDSDHLIVSFFKDFPLYFDLIGKPSEILNQKTSKYPVFCMKFQGDNFKPLVKSSLLEKIKSSPEKYSTDTFIEKTLFKCFIFAKEHPNLIMINHKAKTIKFKLDPVENTTSWSRYQVFSLTFTTEFIGQYFIYYKNQLVPMDFLINRVMEIDVKKSFVSFTPSLNRFICSFFSQNSEKFLLKKNSKVEKSCEKFEQSFHCFEIRFISENGIAIEHSHKIVLNTIELSIILPKDDEVLRLEVKVNGKNIRESPFLFDSSMNFDAKYQKFIKFNSDSRFFKNEVSVTIDRSRFFESFDRNFPDNPRNVSSVKVYYLNESGVDAGGLTRDFFESLGKYSCLPESKLFEKRGTSFRVHPDCNPAKMFKIGAGLANGIIHGHKIPISLCNSLVKLLLSRPLNNKDLQEDNQDLFNSINEILGYSEEELLSLYQTFSVQLNGETFELIPGGNSVFVDQSNKENFVNLSILWELKGYAEKAIENFVDGFQSVAKEVNGFTVKEFKRIFYEFTQDDAEFLKKNIFPKSPMMKRICEWLLQYLDTLDLEKIQMFLQLVTGSSSVPVNRQNWKIIIQAGTFQGIIAHTCFNRIDVPMYRSYEKLCSDFEIAIEHCAEAFTFS